MLIVFDPITNFYRQHKSDYPLQDILSFQTKELSRLSSGMAFQGDGWLEGTQPATQRHQMNELLTELWHVLQVGYPFVWETEFRLSLLFG